MALASLLTHRLRRPRSAGARSLAALPAKAKNVIFLFMAGGPSQLELFDHKPKLDALNGQPIPEEFIKGKRFAFMDSFAKQTPKLLGTRRNFARHGQSGSWVSDCLPHIRRASSMTSPSCGRWPRMSSITPRPRCSSTPGRRSSAGRAWAPGSPTASAAPRAICPASSSCSPDRADRAAGRRIWGSGFLPTTLPGRALPQRRRTDSQSDQSARRRPPNGSATPSTRSRNSMRRAWPTSAIRRSPRASPPTRWPTACRPAPRS